MFVDGLLQCSCVEAIHSRRIEREFSAVVAVLTEVLALFLTAKVSTLKDSYLVDPASSHMLVSKIKPCMSKYKPT